MKAYEQTLTLLDTLQLRGIRKRIDEEINEAEAQKVSYLGFLNALLRVELSDRTERRLRRNMSAAHFPILKTLEGFEFGRVKGVTKSDVSQLLDFRWVDNHDNLLWFGPPLCGAPHKGGYVESSFMLSNYFNPLLSKIYFLYLSTLIFPY